jgi:LuxR family maltose regulon positive regulatory protein
MPWGGRVMSTPLLATKLYIPPLRANLVQRPRLIERLDKGQRSGYRLALISAPAGFGKTALLSEWVQAMGSATPPMAVAWLSLDGEDNDPARQTHTERLLQRLGHQPGVMPAKGQGRGTGE